MGLFEEMGIKTGIDLEKMIALGGRAESIIGRQLRSNYILAGPVPHQGRAYDKQRGILPSAPSAEKPAASMPSA